MGSKKDVNTEPFRQAIWYYIHSIKGIRHDDYNYRRVSNYSKLYESVLASGVSKLRQSINKLVHLIGLHPNFIDCLADFVQVNEMLDITFKTYVRMVSCFPEKAAKFDFETCMGGLDNSEKVYTLITEVDELSLPYVHVHLHTCRFT